MAIPSHRIHTIHGTFGGHDYAPSTPLSASQALSFTHLPNVTVGRGGRSYDLSILASRTTPASASASSLPAQPSFKPRARRQSMCIPSSTRRAPSPPLRTALTVVMSEDPFADAPDDTPIPVPIAPQYTAPISSRTRLVTYVAQPCSLSSPPGCDLAAVAAREHKAARGRLVANVLLNRAEGRPLHLRKRGWGEAEGSREYVRSGLSRMVAAAC
ncbi:hypothetical protein A0H81_04948 [Grifola frondosa]|uniref:Uncharacterized protein n=1 Tax=Grifola frondosa TaxID=5627 RepID=A0A1C7MDQ0_GRIFR|nr:hypothetical protein A0H81_04948 [Grifola frondosa]